MAATVLVYNINGLPAGGVAAGMPTPPGYYASPVEAAIARGQDPTLGMQVATPNSVLNEFFRVPAYQLTFGAQDYNNPYSLVDPVSRFKFDPAYDFLQEEGFRGLQRYGAAQGLLESGPMQRELLKFSKGLADSQYDDWLGKQIGVYSDYTNQLLNLASFGAGQTGSQNAFNQGQGIAAMVQNTGANAANAALTTGSNIASLFGNQGVFGGSGMMNTAAAQSNNFMQGLSIQAQLAAAQAASGGGGGGGGMGGIGSLLSGAGSLLGSFF